MFCKALSKRGNDGMLELFEYYEPRNERIGLGRGPCELGFTHIGFDVDQIEARVRQLHENNVQLLSDVVEFRPGVKLLYFKGPDGEMCEFRELQKNGKNDEQYAKV